VGAERAAPIPRGPAHRGPAQRRPGGPPRGPGLRTPLPLGGNRARQSLLAGVGPVMRACSCGCGGTCEDSGVSRSALPGVGPVMRSCSCGCGGTCEEASVSRQAAPGAGPAPASPAGGGVAGVVGRQGRGLDRRTRRRMESRFGRDFGGVRVHTDGTAAASARQLGARAYTVGNHIVFGAGQYAPDRHEGQHLIAHELAHTVQQRTGRHLQAAGTVSRPSDPHEREAESVARAVMAGRSAAPGLTAPTGMIQRDWIDDAENAAGNLLDRAGEVAHDVVEGGEELASDIVEGGKAVARDVVAGVGAAWDLAHDIAAAVGGAISVSGCGITVTVPRLAVNRFLTVSPPLPDASFELPLAVGVWPITGLVNAYGMIYLKLSAIPTLALQFGPAAINGARFFIDWCAPTYGGSVNFTYSLAASLGVELRGGIGGEVGLEVNVPVPPVVIPVPIPVASVEVGVAGAVRGTGAMTVTEALSLAYSGGTLAYSDASHTDAGLKLSAGVGAYGALTVLGMNLCTLYWPLWMKSWSDTWAIDRALDVSFGSGGVSLDYDAKVTQPGDLAFEDLPVALNTEVLTDDCPLIETLCRVLGMLGWLPSQNGGTWAGYSPKYRGPWPGPLDVFRRDPGIPSTSLCRGACGPNCETCTELGNKPVCIDDGGRHHWLIYRDLCDCPTHDGCKEHDACYDWSHDGASLPPFLSQRLCDLECVCNHPASDCIGWIFGIGGSGRMLFSNEPVPKPGCEGPCPQEEPHDEGPTTQLTCLPPIVLTDPLVLEKTFADSTGNIPIFSKPLPPVPGVTLSVFGRGDLEATALAAIDPIVLDQVCLDVTFDPDGNPTYTGTGVLHVPARLAGDVTLTGAVDATVDFLCLFQLLGVEGGLSAFGFVSNAIELTDEVAVTCDGGQLDLVNTASITDALELGFDLDAFLKLFVFGIQLYSDSWNLVSARFDRTWTWEIDVLNRSGSGAGLILPTLTVGSVGIVELLQFLLADEPDEPQQQNPGIISRLLSICGSPPKKDKPPPDHPPPPPAPQADDRCGQSRSEGCGVPGAVRPPTHVEFIPPTGDRGEQVIAKPLTNRAGNTHGSRPSDRIFCDVWKQCIAIHNTDKQKETAFWVRAHLLHGETGSGGNNLHGPGTLAGGGKQNLILTDQSLNRNMRLQVEKDAIDAVYKQDRCLWYEVTASPVSDSGHQRFFGDAMHIRWGDFDPVTKQECGPVVDKTITSSNQRPIPTCPNGFNPGVC